MGNVATRNRHSMKLRQLIDGGGKLPLVTEFARQRDGFLKVLPSSGGLSLP